MADSVHHHLSGAVTCLKCVKAGVCFTPAAWPEAADVTKVCLLTSGVSVLPCCCASVSHSVIMNT